MLKDLFRTKPKYVTVKPRVAAPEPRREVPDGLWTKCESCGTILYSKELVKSLSVCEKCRYHFRIGARERLAQVVDEGTFEEMDAQLVPENPLGFPDYPAKLEKAAQGTSLVEAVVTGTGTIGYMPAVIGVIDFGFIAGTMGSAVGEKIARVFERGAAESKPVVFFSAGGGGARMQEGILSLMQMAKTSQAVEMHNRAGQLYISVLTHPTMGGIYASFASLADVTLAEPGALIGFAGPRIVEETIRQKLPSGFQTAEFALKHGMIDRIVDRKEMKKSLVQILRLHKRV